jgi:hypothetical protein
LPFVRCVGCAHRGILTPAHEESSEILRSL